MENSETDDRFATCAGPGLFDCAEAAKYLNLSQSYIRKAVAGNRIPFVRIGTRTLFRRADLDSWIAEHLVPTNSDIRSRAASLAASVMLGPRKGRRLGHE